MKIARPLWVKGVFMTPQHFQQQAFWSHYCDERVARMASADPWGVYRASFDKEALLMGRLKPDVLRVRLPDGTSIDTDVSDWLPSARSLNDAPEGNSEITVSIGLPMYDAQSNCIEGDRASARPRRFLREDLHVADIHGDSTEEMAVERHALGLLFDFEPQNDYVTCPVARLVRNSQGRFEVDETFVPPSLVISASSHLVEYLNRLLEILAAKSLSLAARRKQRSDQVADYDVADVGMLWLLHCVNTAWPELDRMAQAPDQHPERLYTVMARLAGALLALAPDETLKSIPSYDHEALGATFAGLDRLIRRLLDNAIPSSVVPITLEKIRPTLWSGHINDERLVEKTDYYLAVRTDLPASDALEQLQRLCKVGAPDDVQRIINSALSGIPLQFAQRLPVAMPVRADSHYFALDTRHPAFKSMMSARACQIYVPVSLPDVSVELYGVLPA